MIDPPISSQPPPAPKPAPAQAAAAPGGAPDTAPGYHPSGISEFTVLVIIPRPSLLVIVNDFF